MTRLLGSRHLSSRYSTQTVNLCFLSHCEPPVRKQLLRTSRAAPRVTWPVSLPTHTTSRALAAAQANISHFSFPARLPTAPGMRPKLARAPKTERSSSTCVPNSASRHSPLPSLSCPQDARSFLPLQDLSTCCSLC